MRQINYAEASYASAIPRRSTPLSSKPLVVVCMFELSALVPIIFGSLLWPIFGLTTTFGVIGLLVVVGVVWMWLAMPETKGELLDHTVPVDREIAEALVPQPGENIGG